MFKVVSNNYVLNQCHWLPFTVPDPPTNVQTSQVGEVRVKVTWNRPMLTSTVSTSGYAIAVNNQSPTTVPAQTLSQTLGSWNWYS